MKKYLTLVLVLYCCIAWGQEYDYNKVWVFADSAGIDFNISPPAGITTAITGYEGTASVSDQGGQLLFYTEGRSVWSRNHMLMPNGTGLMPNAASSTTTQQAAIANVPGSTSQFYIFSLNDANGRHLLYSRVNMNLNGGFGDVIPGQKAIVMDSLLTEKMLLVPGNNCDSWLIVRSTTGTYKAYHITQMGINPVPVLSAVGSGTPISYQYGYLVASPDRSKIAASIGVAAELYDFDANTGLLSNPFQIPTPQFGSYYGLCFSPDNSKLYTAGVNPGIEQFDLSLATPAAIIASRTLISMNVSRSIRLAANGKIYIPKELTDTMRSIDNPNLAGTACSYNNFGAVLPPGSVNMIGLPNYNAVIYPEIVGNHYVHYLCDDSIQLSPFNAGVDYLWENGSSNPQRTVNQPGTYILRYHLICSNFHDTFRVLAKPPFPRIGLIEGSCTGQQNGKVILEQQANDTTTYSYTWYDNNSNILHQNISGNGSQLNPAAAGSYQIKVSTIDGCDTLISVTVPALSGPVAAFDAGTKFCAGEAVHFTNNTTGPASLYRWDFGDQSYSTQSQPDHTYGLPGVYSVILIADNGNCSDTAYRDITIYDFDLSLTADKTTVDFKESFTLQTAAAELYSITAWIPQPLFPDQQALQQYRLGDTTLTYIVTGHSSAHQCIDTASFEVIVNPFINFPSAFSPNGDGLNDYFAPIVWGSDPGIKRFMVYDRWGKKVWSGTGAQALKGWNGLYTNGGRADVGTYYWYLELGNPLKGKKSFKGDVTLMR